MTIIDGYTITQHPNRNYIIITLPQRTDTVTNTVSPLSNRRKRLTDKEEAALLVAVRGMFENKTRGDEVKE